MTTVVDASTHGSVGGVVRKQRWRARERQCCGIKIGSRMRAWQAISL